MRITCAKRYTESICSEYPMAKIYAHVQLTVLISVLYVTVAPLIKVLGFIYFIILHGTDKFVTMFLHRPFFILARKCTPALDE